MPVERREQVTRVEIVRVNGQPEELAGFGGRRQPSLGGTSRMNREVHVRICERLGVKFPRGDSAARWQGHVEQLEKPSSSHQENRWSARSYNRQNREVDRRRNGGGQARSSGEAVTSAEPRGPAAHNVGINKGGRGEMIK